MPNLTAIRRYCHRLFPIQKSMKYITFEIYDGTTACLSEPEYNYFVSLHPEYTKYL